MMNERRGRVAGGCSSYCWYERYWASSARVARWRRVEFVNQLGRGRPACRWFPCSIVRSRGPVVIVRSIGAVRAIWLVLVAHGVTVMCPVVIMVMPRAMTAGLDGCVLA